MRGDEVLCSYCGEPAKLVTGKDIYPHRPEFAERKYWQCKPCDAYVGCHAPTHYTNERSDVPLGRLANAELRAAKQKAHTVFDRIWKENLTTRRSAYALLAARLGIRNSACHIGMFDLEMCKKTVRLGDQLYHELKGM